MSPIRSKPFGTKSAGQQTTKVLDGKMRVFATTIDVGNFAQVYDSNRLTVRYLTSSNWYSPESTSNPNYMVGSANKISGYSTNTFNNTEGYIIVALNKMCRIYYDLTISSENNYDWGSMTLSTKSTGWTSSVVPTSGTPQYAIPRISGETSVSGYIDMDVWNVYGNNYDIGTKGDQGEMLLCLEYDTDGSTVAGSNRYTVNSLYVTDLP